jgi:hypothetical protein
MKIILGTLKKVLFWSYERGSWQYDLMCVLILGFILLAPNRVFQLQASEKPLIVRSADVGPIDLNDLPAVETRLGQMGYVVSVSRIEKGEDATGEVYVVWKK